MMDSDWCIHTRTVHVLRRRYRDVMLEIRPPHATAPRTWYWGTSLPVPTHGTATSLVAAVIAAEHDVDAYYRDNPAALATWQTPAPDTGDE